MSMDLLVIFVYTVYYVKFDIWSLIYDLNND